MREMREKERDERERDERWQNGWRVTDIEEEGAVFDVLIVEGEPDAGRGQERHFGGVLFDFLRQHGDGAGRVPVLVELPLLLRSGQKPVLHPRGFRR